MNIRDYINIHIPQYYPTEKLPKIIEGAVTQVYSETQSPISMIALAAISRFSIAAQAMYRVERLPGLQSTISLFTVSICQSGERKTSVDKKFTKPFETFEKENRLSYSQRKTSYETELRNHKAKSKGFLRKLAKSIENNESTKEIETQIAEHDKTKPIPPRLIKFIYNDSSSSAFLHGLHINSRSAALVEDEGARLLGSSIHSDMGLLNKGWDGSNIKVDRINNIFEIEGPRFNVSIMVQPGIFAKFMEKKGTEAKNIGLFARWLVCYPPTTIGTRLLNNHINHDPQALDKFNDRIYQLLKKQETENGIISMDDEIILRLSTLAQSEWINFYNQIEEESRPGGIFYQHAEYAAKMSEVAARIAGVFHISDERNDGVNEISLETINNAISITLWHAAEYLRIFTPPPPLRELAIDAQTLESWIIEHIKIKGMPLNNSINKTTLLQYGPNSLRKRDKLNCALQLLQDTGRLSVITYLYQNGEKASTVVSLNVFYYGNIARGMPPVGFFPALQ